MKCSKFRIAQVLAGAKQGGAEKFFVRLVRGLNDSDKFKQKAFLRNHQHRVEALEASGVDVETFRFGGCLNFFDTHKYNQALLRFSPDIVMTWMNRASRLTHRGPYQLVCRLGHFYNLKYYRHADYWVGNTKGICDHLVKGGMPAEKVFHIPNFADEAPVSPLNRGSFSTPLNGALILAAGRLHINKGFDILLKALANIDDTYLWLAGSGPEEQSLKKLCADLGLNDRVRFLGWRDDVTALMKTADLFVCPSRHEGLGSIVLESWAHGCPIVATESQGPREVIENGVTGLLTPIDDVAALERAIVDVITNNTLANSLVKSALNVYSSNYSEAVIIQNYEKFYDCILK